ncbi:hypothetical protein [Methylotuvimicrobium sp.]|uniref:hypothetical protein n=1 Tax=Methylotuvimicrobium sp. TaxID=2822413 RepID=UPI003D662A99
MIIIRRIRQNHHKRTCLKNQPKPRQQLTDADIEREARPGEPRAAVIARLTGNSVAKDAKPGEIFDQVLQRKRELADVRRKLR